jgi:hypothetical protein
VVAYISSDVLLTLPIKPLTQDTALPGYGWTARSHSLCTPYFMQSKIQSLVVKNMK